LFKELCQNKPSIAIRACLDGTEEFQKNGFVVDMGDYGYVDKEKRLCGCMATCAIQKLTNKSYSSENISSYITRADFLGVHPYSLFAFQQALSRFVMCATADSLSGFFGIDLPRPKKKWYIEKYSPKDKQLDNIREYITQLEELGL